MPITLRELAAQYLNEAGHPQDRHIFRHLSCPDCQSQGPFEIKVQWHSGAKTENFRGQVCGQCLRCGAKNVLFRYSGSHRRLDHETLPRCSCGSVYFYIGQMERYESDEGLSGFFDEGVLVLQCAHCDASQVLLAYD